MASSKDKSDSAAAATEASEDTVATKAPKPIGRLGIGSSSILQILLVFASVFLINYLSCGRSKQFDLTPRGDHSLSEKTGKFLTSSMVKERKSPIKVIAIMHPRQFAHYEDNVIQRLRNVLEEYRRQSNNMIEIEFVNPIVNASRIEELSSAYNLTFSKSLVLVDARRGQDEAIPKAELDTVRLNLSKAQLKALTPDAIAKLKEKAFRIQELATNVRQIPADSLFFSEFNRIYEKHFIASWRDEATLTTAMINAIEGKPRTIYLLEDKCQFESKQGGKAPWQNAAQLLALDNIHLKRIRIAGIKRIPDDADGIALIAPTIDFTEDELKIFDEYWGRNGASVFITLDPTKKLRNLQLKLREYGITPRFDRIVRVDEQNTLTDVQATFTHGSKVNGSLAGKTSIFDGSSTSLEVAEGDHRLEGRRIMPFPLLEAESSWWGETKFGEGTPTYDRRTDHRGRLCLGAAVTRGTTNDETKAHLISRMVVLGNTDFMSPKNIREEQTNYVSQVGNWLVGREELIGIGAQNIIAHKKMTILPAHKSFLDKIFLLFIPLFTLAIMLLVWNVRRS